MARKTVQSKLAFPVVLGLMLLMSLSPTSWIQPWTGDLSSMLRILLRPFTHAGETVSVWLRAPAGSHLDLPPEERERRAKAGEERDRFERLFRAAEQEIMILQEQLNQIQLLPDDEFRADVLPLQASIVSRHPTDSQGLVRLNRARRHGVEPGMIAVFAGVHLMGRISEVSKLDSTLLPLTHPSTGFIEAAIISGDSSFTPLSEAPLIQLTPTSDGQFTATADRAWGVADGDVVRLMDRLWPPVAQAMVIGTVSAVQKQDSNPLRDSLIVRPRYLINKVSQVTLLGKRSPVDPVPGNAP